MRNLGKALGTIGAAMLFATLAAGCAAETGAPPTTESAKGDVAIARTGADTKLSVGKLTILRATNVTVTLANGGTVKGADTLSVSDAAGNSIRFIKASEGYAMQRTGALVADRAAILQAADAAGHAGDKVLAAQLELAAERIAAPTVIDPSDPAPGAEIFTAPTVGADGTLAQSSSHCSQAQENAQYSWGGVVNWRVRAFWHTFASGTEPTGPNTDACMGRCGSGCDWTWAGTKYTEACMNHDGCVRRYGLTNWRCDAIFGPTIWDTVAADNCF